MQDAARPFSLQQASVFLAVLIVSILSPFVDAQVRLCVLLLAVTFNTWYGGLRQGTMAAVFSALIILANSLAMSHSIRIEPMQGIRLSVFLVSCYLLNRFAMSHRLAEALRCRNEDWNRKLLETAREGFWVFDNEWRTTYVNNRLAEMLGYAQRELLGEDFREFLVDGFRIRSAQDLTRRDHEHSDQQDLRFRRSDGSRLWATVTTSPVTNDRGAVVGLLAVVEDVTERKRAERDLDKALRALQISEARHGRLVESNIIGIITADLSGDVLEANDAFLRMVGYTREDLNLGQVRWSDMTPPEFMELDQQATNELWATGASVPYEKQFTRKDGELVPVLIGAAALERYPKTWIGFALDLTERKRSEAALQEAKEAAESASRAKDQFLAMLSHELRTPLTPVLLMATAMLEEPDIPAEIRTMLELTRRNVQLEARLIDDLLDITRISRGKLDLNRENVNAHALIQQALEICRDDIRANELQLSLELAAGEHHVDGDPARLQQVFWNLIKNAVKFTPRGGSLTIRSFHADPFPNTTAARFIVEVSDTGIGIEPHTLPKIFDAFEQGDSATRRRFGGLGLGLAISRSVVTAHGGRLSAFSAGKDQGANFTLELATVPALAPVTQAPAPSLRTGSTHRPLKILLVEDNKETLRYLSWILAQHQHKVYTADCMWGALEVAQEDTFDLVISDIELPDGSGLELMQRLGGGLEFPGIALSGFGSEDDVQMSKAAGFSEHLTKPVDFLKLEETIYNVTSAIPHNEFARAGGRSQSDS
ncbi:hybrid sensor histidine kinase/response regulator [Singulisphaera acidiphila]|uniref:histidine kinase n=1 Tax=Singulisphaera acidiphila (strain ATCC BAA-1392 / DSM 18658 / VKM B-2454 / MOB10) TaxID=886293 RepID=L0DM63_SINAD|nr:PAS domain S-box protein [Singulisphaera acidiphila]AGA30469.1 PAS domain S-box [Singulisphaera acidiphila DSM 18658]